MQEVLRFNPHTQEFFVQSDDADKAKRIGMTLATKVRGQDGERIWFTDSHYAALSYFEAADDRARQELEPLWSDYQMSWADHYDGDFPLSDYCKRMGYDYEPYQKAGIAYGLYKGNVLIGDEPGLGKTIQAIGIANASGAKKVLVICPGNIRIQWRREIQRWSVIDAVSTTIIDTSKQWPDTRKNYVVVSYELARNPYIHEVLCEQRWDMIVLDEAHYLKTREAQRTRAVFGGGERVPFNKRWLSMKTDRIVGLTGTPLPNRPRECYTLARNMAWESIDWLSEDNFKHRFNPSGVVGNGHTLEMRGRLPELRARLRCNFMIRRLKSQVLKQMPPKRYEMAYIESNGAIARALERERMLDFDIADLVDPRGKIDGAISTVRREMGEAKIPRIIEHMEYLLDILEMPKVVLFLHHRSVMDAVGDGLAKYGVAQLRGGMSLEKKQAGVDRFMEDPDCKLWIGQTDAAGVGVDGLQRVCQHAVFGEPAWTPGANEQAVDRLHRKGQLGSVRAQFLIVEGSLDERVLAAVLEKTETIHQSLDEGGWAESPVINLDAEDRLEHDAAISLESIL